MGPYADQLLANVQEIVERADEVTLEPLQLANGAKALLDEIATGKITGEEERYSHTDLWDFAGNLDGLEGRHRRRCARTSRRTTPTCSPRSTERFAATEAELDTHRAGDGWRALRPAGPGRSCTRSATASPR